VYAVGTIVPGKGGRRGALGMQIGSRALVEAFEDAARDSEVKAIVFRIDSPGGSASASDAVWRSVRLARERKPVIASLSDVAASGGYYMAAGADHVVAEPNTLTGSIGVVMFKPNASGLLDWMGIGSESLARGRFARILDVTKGLDRAEQALLKTQMDGVYKRFLDRVAEGRTMTVEEVDHVGGGRVWTGRQALEAGLVDQIGGLRDAVRAAAVEAGVADPDSVRLVYFPEAKGLAEQLAGVGGGGLESMAPALLEPPIAALSAYAPLAPGVQAIMSGALVVH
jgi:protease-4